MSKLTPSEIKEEMLKVKVPWFVGFAEKFWFKAGRFIVFFGLLSFVPLFIIYNKIALRHVDTMWTIMLGWGAFIFGCGLLMLVSHLIEKSFVKKQADRLGITVWQWNMYAKELNLRSYKE
jgi:hypothetical protein